MGYGVRGCWVVGWVRIVLVGLICCCAFVGRELVGAE